MAEVAVIDPPWPQRKGGLRSTRPLQTRSLDYTTLPVDEIFGLLERENFLAPTVFMWATEKSLRWAEDEMERRDYRLHVRLIWDKGNGVAPAFTVRYSHEYLLWFYRSPMMPIAREQRGKPCSVIRAPGREHSRKPDEAYTLVSKLYPDAKRIDVFSREERIGWETWGSEKGLFPPPAVGQQGATQ